MTLDMIMFYHVIFPPFLVMVGCVRAKVSIFLHILNEVVMYLLNKGDVFECIGIGRKNNWILLCELHQDWFGFL